MFRSYCFTVRPLQGLTQLTEGEILKWLKKQDYAFATIEGKDEARHMHGQIWLKEPRARGKVNQSIKRICERSINEWAAIEAKVLSKGTKIAYSDWFDSYLNNDLEKSHEFEYIVINNPPDKTEEFYPSQEEQERIQGEAHAVDKQMHRWEQVWYTREPKESSIIYNNIDRFVRECWFVTRTECGPRCPKNQKNFIRYLYMYINKLTHEPNWKDLVEGQENIRILTHNEEVEESDSDGEYAG